MLLGVLVRLPGVAPGPPGCGLLGELGVPELLLRLGGCTAWPALGWRVYGGGGAPGEPGPVAVPVEAGPGSEEAGRRPELAASPVGSWSLAWPPELALCSAALSTSPAVPPAKVAGSALGVCP